VSFGAREVRFGARICVYLSQNAKKSAFFREFYMPFFPQQNDSSLPLPAFQQPSRPHNSRFPDSASLLDRLGTHLQSFLPFFLIVDFFLPETAGQQPASTPLGRSLRRPNGPATCRDPEGGKTNRT
jgi:hypothetical protein